MYRRLARVGLLQLKQVLHTTQVLKFGRTCPIMVNAISGRLAAFCTKWRHSTPLLLLRTSLGLRRR